MKTINLLYCGIFAAIVSPIIVLAQIITREGFDINRHPLSMLSLGEFGWLQILNFILGGVLFIAFSIGLHRQLRDRAGGTLGPILFGMYGIALILAGIFTVDPMDGFPPGTPLGIPDTLSWHAQIHNLTFFVVFFSLLAVQFVFARRYWKSNKRGWAIYCIISAILTPALIFLAYATPPLYGIILFSMGILNNLWIILIAMQTIKEA